jgi:hypothetical protein
MLQPPEGDVEARIDDDDIGRLPLRTVKEIVGDASMKWGD